MQLLNPRIKIVTHIYRFIEISYPTLLKSMAHPSKLPEFKFFWVDWVRKRTNRFTLKSSCVKFRSWETYKPNIMYLYRTVCEISWSQGIVLWRWNRWSDQILSTLNFACRYLRIEENRYTKFQVPSSQPSWDIAITRVCFETDQNQKLCGFNLA